MQLIPDATKTAILQPYLGVGKGLIPSSDRLANCTMAIEVQTSISPEIQWFRKF
jgi:hypothetical protein